MSDGMAAVQSRILELQSLLGVRPSSGASSTSASSGTMGASATDFATALQTALADGALNSDGSSGTGRSSVLDNLSTLVGAGGANGSSGLSALSALTGSGSSATTSLLDALAKLSAATGGAAKAGSSATPSPPRTTADVGAQAVTLAAQYTGVPYQWGGEDPKTGLDCSGLTQLVYSKLGVTLPRVAADQSHAGTAVDSLAQAQPGDLVFFGSPAHHVGIYVGDGKMIDAPHTGKSVGVHPLWSTPSSIRRVATVPGAGAADAASGDQAVPDPTADRFGTTVSPAGAVSTVSAASATSGADVVGASDSSTLSGPYANLFVRAGAKYSVDPALLSAVAKAESAYNPRAVSSAGAQGLMQLMPATARSVGVNDPYNPADAVDGAAQLLSGLLDRFGGRVDLALAGYNAGPGAVQRYGGVPPYAETQNYVHRVTQYWEALR